MMELQTNWNKKSGTTVEETDIWGWNRSKNDPVQ
jgi:hypothetical protein